MTGDDNLIMYLFRGKVETEVVERFSTTKRAQQLQGVTASTIYVLVPSGKIKVLSGMGWVSTDTPPDEIKLAAMLVN